MAFAQLAPRPLSLASMSVAKALVLSCLIHAVVILAVELGYQTGFWKTTFLFAKREQDLDAERIRMLQQMRAMEEEMPLIFVQVDPSQSVPEPPRDAKYYSAVNSRAANPDTQKETEVPKIDGKQDRVPQTMDRALEEPKPAPPAPEPLAPNVAKAEPEPEPEPDPPTPPEPKPEPKPRPGDLALATPSETQAQPRPKPSSQTERPKPPPQRPRRLDQARLQKGIAGERMKQAGGVRRFSLEPSLDVRATPFGSYDALIIAAIQKRWYDLLASRDFAANYSGKVIVEFRLNSNGRVTDMKVTENTVTEILALLCQRAVQDPAPFEPWPADLRRMVNRDYREVRFTFYYN